MGLDELTAHIEIQQVLYRYCRGVDRGDAAMIASVYHPEAIDRHGSWSGLGKDFGGYLVPNMDATPLIGQHHITNTLIQVHGDEAEVESYFVAFHPETRDSGPAHAVVCGRYLDRFAKRGGAWLIADRQVVIDVSRAPAREVDWPGAGFFPAGGRRETDPSATHFLKV
jgi:hypothetical protein